MGRLLDLTRAGAGQARQWLRALPPWLPRWAGRVAVALVGALLGLLLGGRTSHEVGPFEANLALTVGHNGGTVLQVPPLGTLGFDSHRGPLSLRIQLARLNQAEAQDLLHDPRLLRDIGDQVADDIRSAIGRLVLKSGLCAVAGGVLLSLLVYRRRREALLAGGLTVALLGGTAGWAGATWRPEALREPTYSGLLANAPTLVGSAQDILDRFDVYRQELAGLVTNVSRLYAATSSLPAYQPDDSTIRLLHVSDLHLNPAAYSIIKSVVRQFGVNVVADTGDLTDWGSEPETRYVAGIRSLGVPYVYIRGNHDSARTAAAVAAQPNSVVLTGGPPRVVAGLSFAGIGDPRFTPDKETRDDTASRAQVESAGADLARVLTPLGNPPDVTMLHDPISAEPLTGIAPLVLAGHIHKHAVRQLDGTLLLVEGSTGGAGLRGLQNEQPTPIECSVLYFDSTSHALQAYDEITIGGLGQSEATIQRHLVTNGRAAEPSR